VSTKFDAQLAGTMIKAISVAFLVILILLVVQLRSLRDGLGAAAPMLFTVLMNLAAMSLMRIALDNTTLMISSIALGVSVMYAIHFISRFNAECTNRMAPDQALETTMSFKGRGIVINTLTVALGFGVLVFSVMAPQRQFGLFIALTMLLANIGTFTILPAVILMGKTSSSKPRS
jgi:predicted RND superfamily exporter protein